MSRYFTLHIVQGCEYCQDALELLAKNKEEYVIHDLTHSQRQINEAKEKNGWNTFPIILLNESNNRKLIGGYDDLKKFYETNQ